MMTKERKAELEAIADKDPHMCLLRELLNEIAELEALAVVVPKPTGRDLQEMAAEMRIDGDLVDFLAGASKVVLWYRSKIRAIPADRVLGEGMAAISESLATLLQELVFAVDAFLAESSPWIGPGAPAEVPELTEIASRRLQCMLDQIRANQGGTDHG